MRIIAGKYRRRKLLANPGLRTRPITDRAKEILFERLAGDIVEKRILDLFAGTGTIGLEALSRGASGVVFVENDRRAVELLKQNVSTLEVESQSLCWQTDVLRCSFRPKNVDHLTPFDTVFFDPPYRMLDDLAPGTSLYRSLERLLRDEVTGETALLVIRTPRYIDCDVPSGWTFDRAIDLKSMCALLFDKQLESADGVQEQAESAESR